MSEMAEMWSHMKQLSQQKRARNREDSARLLREAGVQFTTHNGGAHLIVEGPTALVDFWPGTGAWHSRCGTRNRGVANLLRFIQGATK